MVRVNPNKLVSSILIISFLIISSGLTTGLNDFELPSDLNPMCESISKTADENSDPTTNLPRSIPSREPAGGSWIDSFQDGSRVDYAQCDHLNFSNEEAKIIDVKKGPLKVDNNTVALWHMDNGSGSSINDSTTNNNDGTFVNSPGWVTGRYKKGLDFFNNDAVRVPHSNSLDITGNITIEAWIKAKGIGSYLCIVDKYYGSTSMIDNHGYTLYIGVGQLRLSIYSGSNGFKTAQGNFDLRDNKWHYVAGVYNGTHISVYTDGNLDTSTPWGYPPNSTTNDLGIGLRLSGWGGFLPFNGVIDDVRISNTARSSKEIWEYYHNVVEYRGNLTSKPINIPAGMNWDSLIINKTQPDNSFVNITILNASNNQPIPGSQLYDKEGEFDISYIDSIKYPSIKLNATYECDGTVTPILYYWGVGWNTPNAWRDTFFGGMKIELSDKIKTNIIDGRLIFEQPTILTSTIINIPTQNYFDVLQINKENGWFLKVTILDAQTNLEIPGFEEIYNTTIDIFSINPMIHPMIKLKATFESDSMGSAILYDWSVNWTKNTSPLIENIDIPMTSVNRTHAVNIKINLSDNEELENNITLKVEYQSPDDTYWENTFLTDPIYDTDHWECIFTPSKIAKTGTYSFKVTCNDSFQNSSTIEKKDFINVINNKPTQPTVKISPHGPKTLDDLLVEAKDSQDIETQKKYIKYWYRWYKNNFYLQNFENSTVVPYTSIAKGETWRCVVYPFDGMDLGNPGIAEVIVQNTPPERVGEFNYIEIFEDTSIILEDKLSSIFTDGDLDNLNFSSTGQNNITVKIIQENGTLEIIPDENWFGTEQIEFSATDSSDTHAETIVEVKVIPTNDLPVITQLEDDIILDNNIRLEYTIDQNDWLNLTIYAEDIDGDLERGMGGYILNITERSNLNIQEQTNKFIFHPTNLDVGLHYIDIKVTDNNETPIEYVTLPIRIRVNNVNDPPTVRILSPGHGLEFSDDYKITFSCMADDFDLQIKDSPEKLSFRWSTNNSNLPELGYAEVLTNLTLPPGYYNVTVTVEDVTGKSAYDYIHIFVNATPKDEPDDKKALQNFLWLVLLIIGIFVVLIALFAFYYNRKTKKEIALEGLGIYGTQPQVQGATIASALPTVQNQPLGAAPPSPNGLPQPTSQPTPSLTTQPQPQLPPVQVPTQVPTSSTAQPMLTQQQKLELLEERLLLGEVDEEVYLNLKSKYEQEARSTQPVPTTIPKLPPATTITSTTPTPTPSITTSQQKQPQEQPPEPPNLPQNNTTTQTQNTPGTTPQSAKQNQQKQNNNN